MSTQETKLKAIADAIREKDGTTEPIPANDFPERIRAIPTGGMPDNVRTITVTADPPEGGTVSGGGYASDGMKITVSASNGEGYSFSEWKENNIAVSTDASYTFTVTENRNLTSVFENVPTYTITASIDPEGSGTVTGAGEYQEGTQATVKAVPGEGYEFVAWKEPGASRLPTGYTELEYIQSSGTQYINTGFNPTTNTKSVLDLKLTDTSGTFVPFGAKLDSTTREKQYFVMAMGSTSRFEANYFSRTEANLVNLFDYKNRGMLSLDGNMISFNDSSAPLSYTAGENEVPYPMYLFGYNLSGTITSAASMALYSCKIYESGTLVRNFIPCSDPTGAIGMYDLVGGTFYANAGTGTFIAGPEASSDVTVSEDQEYTFTVTGDRELVAVFAVMAPKEFPYTGGPVSVTLGPGRYKLEVWGARGGYRSNAAYAGQGGYSTGILTLTERTDLFVRVGGSGNTGGKNGGFNGGGKRGTYPGGGGASDIRIGTDDANHRVIVAGGGGSDGAANKTGMYGGGENGGNASQSYGTGGFGGTQTGVSNSSWQTSTPPTSTTDQTGAYAGFGFGGNGITKGSGYGGAGGGGWYGGSGAVPDSSGDDDRGGGGGSGFVWTGVNAPAGFGLTEAYYLQDAQTIDGSKSFPAPNGTTETGHGGDGYARITPLPPSV